MLLFMSLVGRCEKVMHDEMHERETKKFRSNLMKSGLDEAPAALSRSIVRSTRSRCTRSFRCR